MIARTMMETETCAARLERIRAKVAENPGRMTVQVARELKVAEVEVIRALPDDRAVELDAARWEPLLRAFEQFGNVHVIATNGSVTLECFGQFGNFSSWGEYFNVQTKSLDMHVRHAELGAIFAVEKPSHMDGVSTLSFQFFDKKGDAAFKVFLTFGGKSAPPEKRDAFEVLRNQFALTNASAPTPSPSGRGQG